MRDLQTYRCSQMSLFVPTGMHGLCPVRRGPESLLVMVTLLICLGLFYMLFTDTAALLQGSVRNNAALAVSKNIVMVQDGRNISNTTRGISSDGNGGDTNTAALNNATGKDKDMATTQPVKDSALARNSTETEKFCIAHVENNNI